MVFFPFCVTGRGSGGDGASGGGLVADVLIDGRCVMVGVQQEHNKRK